MTISIYHPSIKGAPSMIALMPIATHLYKGCIISRSTSPGALKWGSYVNGRFVYADTLAGCKELITKELSQ